MMKAIGFPALPPWDDEMDLAKVEKGVQTILATAAALGLTLETPDGLTLTAEPGNALPKKFLLQLRAWKLPLLEHLRTNRTKGPL